MLDEEEFKQNLNELVSLITNLSASQKQLSMAALDAQAMGLASKHQIEAAVNRAANLGKSLDVLIAVLNSLLERISQPPKC